MNKLGMVMSLAREALRLPNPIDPVRSRAGAGAFPLGQQDCGCGALSGKPC